MPKSVTVGAFGDDWPVIPPDIGPPSVVRHASTAAGMAAATVASVCVPQELRDLGLLRGQRQDLVGEQDLPLSGFCPVLFCHSRNAT